MKMAKNLFLDDVRNPSLVYQDFENWNSVRNYDEFVNYLNAIAEKADADDMPPMVSFDYMLNYGSNESKDGADCAKYLVEFCIKYGLKLPKCYVHSSYPSATKEIKKELCKYAEMTGEE